MLSLNHLGLVERAGGEERAVALRETLMLFADLSDSATERQDSRRPQPRVAARSCGASARRKAPARRAALEMTVLIDDKAFEGSGAFLIGAALDRFFARICRDQPFHPDGGPHHRTRRDHALAAAARACGETL